MFPFSQQHLYDFRYCLICETNLLLLGIRTITLLSFLASSIENILFNKNDSYLYLHQQNIFWSITIDRQWSEMHLMHWTSFAKAWKKSSSHTCIFLAINQWTNQNEIWNHHKFYAEFFKSNISKFDYFPTMFFGTKSQIWIFKCKASFKYINKVVIKNSVYSFTNKNINNSNLHLCKKGNIVLPISFTLNHINRYLFLIVVSC
jgi:hypothetical protein